MMKAIAIDDEPLALKVLQSLCKNNDSVNLQAVFTKPSEALNYLKQFAVDLVFCDIQMPSITGINLVKSFPQSIIVIFTTAFSEYAAASYELNAIDYLLKPINQKRFNQAIDKAEEYFEYTRKKESSKYENIFIRADFSLVKIRLVDILYIEGLADYLKIHIRNRKTIVARMTMKEMMTKLPSTDFIRVHRSYILPFHRIDAVKGTTILIGEKRFPIGRTYADAFFSRYGV